MSLATTFSVVAECFLHNDANENRILASDFFWVSRCRLGRTKLGRTTSGCLFLLGLGVKCLAYVTACVSSGTYRSGNGLHIVVILGPRRKLQGRFLHVTDMHPDPYYRVDMSPKTACHRRKPKKEKPRAGEYGIPYGCVLFTVSIERI